MAEHTETSLEEYAAESAEHILKALGQEDNPIAPLISSYLETRLATYYILKDLDKTIKRAREVRDGI